MITKEQIDSVMTPRGLHFWSTLISDYIMYDYVLSGRGVHVLVHPEDNSFELFYNPSRTIFELRCPKCSPFYEETPKYNQFDKMLRKFLEVVVDIDPNIL